MEAFQTHRGKIAVLDRANVDTDQIIPKQFLKSIKRTGYDQHLFYDWRYLEDGSENPEFPLNQKKFKGATILVTRHNFGCGSSREHAVWAVAQYGFKVIIAPRKGDVPAFADIFHNNCVKNGVLNIQLTEAEVENIIQMVERNEGLELTANLEEQFVTLHLDEAEASFPFEIESAIKDHLLAGLDEISQSLQFRDEIETHAKKDLVQKYW